MAESSTCPAVEVPASAAVPGTVACYDGPLSSASLSATGAAQQSSVAVVGSSSRSSIINTGSLTAGKSGPLTASGIGESGGGDGSGGGGKSLSVLEGVNGGSSENDISNRRQQRLEARLSTSATAIHAEETTAGAKQVNASGFVSSSPTDNGLSTQNPAENGDGDSFANGALIGSARVPGTEEIVGVATDASVDGGGARELALGVRGSGQPVEEFIPCSDEKWNRIGKARDEEGVHDAGRTITASAGGSDSSAAMTS